VCVMCVCDKLIEVIVEKEVISEVFLEVFCVVRDVCV